MNKSTPSKGAGSRLWTKNKFHNNTKNISCFLIRQPLDSKDPDIDRSLYFLGKALYRYSLLKKERNKNDS